MDFTDIIRQHAAQDGSVPASAVEPLSQAIAGAVEEAAQAGEWKGRYDALAAEFEAYKTAAAEKEIAAQKEALYRSALRAAGVDERRHDVILRATDLAAIRISDGRLEDAQAVGEAIRRDWGDFIPTRTTSGTRVENPPGNAGAGMTREQIMNIRDAAKRQRAIAANIDKFRM